MIDTDQARERLERERDRLQGILREADNHLSTSLTDSTGELSSFDQHPGDTATDTVERAQDESVRAHAAAELEEVDAALERLVAGEYGTCATCGAAIPPERLELLPQTRFCVEHQRARERTQVAERTEAPGS
jgi:RNA polymerase-binding transcription factor DksA